jgi:phosphoserine aminotransferase
MTKRAYVFNPGPAALPLEVLEEAQQHLVDHEQMGLSIMEMSHRSKYVQQLNEETQQLLLELLGLKEGEYHVLFMGGGASTQFALLPMNFLTPDSVANYVLTGSFSDKAYSEAKFIGRTNVAASTKADGWQRIPDPNDIHLSDQPAYVHITTNNTIEGSRYNVLPEVGDIPLFADMTSDILSRPLPFDRFSLIYAGAQKNLGPAGVTAVILKDDLLQRAAKNIPVILRYETFVKDRSLYNTPPVHAIYMTNLMLHWVKKQGGLPAMEQLNREKAGLLYDVIDGSGGYYQGIIHPEHRSDMNVTWRMPNEELERIFLEESKQHNFIGLAGHRSVGGLRASAYNAVPREACQALADFMTDFMKRNG